MPINSRWTVPIPETTLQSWMFGSPDRKLPDRMVFIDANRPDTHFLTLLGWRELSKRIAVGLRKAGLEPGDRVLLFSGNNVYFPAVFMGILMAGGIFTGANPTFVARELAYQLEDSGARFLLCAEASIEVGLEGASRCGMSKNHVFVFDDKLTPKAATKRSQGIKHWTSLIAPVFQSDGYVWHESRPKETTCCLNYSSGTTGVPKGVEITHYNYVANCVQAKHKAELRPDYHERLKTARWLCFLPMYHALAQVAYIIIGPERGIPVVIMPKFDFVQMLEHLQSFKITDLTIVPPIAVALVKHPLTKKYDLSSVRQVLCGAAPLSRSTIEEVEGLWPDGRVILQQGWGMTETTASILGTNPSEARITSSVGVLNANCEAKIMNDDGTVEIPRGERGEIYVRGPNIMKGYWKKPVATAEALTPDGWLKTGDICYVDASDRFYIVDRKKELIKVKGNQVAPAELEAVLLTHPKIADAGVVGITIDGEEKPRAYIVLREGVKSEEKEVAKWMEGQVARFKRLTGGVVFVPDVPKNPSGKILRRFLRDRAKSEVGDPEAKEAKL